jgi:YVTN family beta-propeller protein
VKIMRRIAVLVAAVWFSAGAWAADGPGGCREVIVSNEASGNLAIVDAASATVTATIVVGKRPRGMALSPDGETLYVALSGTPAGGPGVDQAKLPPPDSEADGIGVVDLSTRKLERTIRGVSDPERVAVNVDGRKLFVASEDRGEVVMFDAASGQVLARTPVGAEAEGVDPSPGAIRIYATSEAENRVTVLDPMSGVTLARIKVGARPRSTAFSPNGLRAYVANEAGMSISVIDTAALRNIQTIPLPTGMLPMRIALSPASSSLYVSTGRGRQILAVDPQSGAITARAESGDRPWDLAVSPDGAELYAANGPSNDLSIFKLPALELRARVPTGGKPWGVVCRAGPG